MYLSGEMNRYYLHVLVHMKGHSFVTHSHITYSSAKKRWYNLTFTYSAQADSVQVAPSLSHTECLQFQIQTYKRLEKLLEYMYFCT